MAISKTPYINKHLSKGFKVRIPVARVGNREYKKYAYTTKFFMFSEFKTLKNTLAAAEEWRDYNILKNIKYDDKTITGNNGGLVRRETPRLRSNDLPVGIVDSRSLSLHGKIQKMFNVRLQCNGVLFSKGISYGNRRTRKEALHLANLKRNEFLREILILKSSENIERVSLKTESNEKG